MAFNRSIIWFRNNLRLQDNQVLLEAVQKSNHYLLLYIFEEAHWQQTEYGFPRSSDRKLTFIWQSVQNLKKAIEKLGGQLLIRKGEPVKVIEELIASSTYDAVFAPKEAGVYEAQDDMALENMLAKKGLEFIQFSQNTLFHEDDIPWPISKLPDIFTQFRKENEKQTKVRNLFPEPETLKDAIQIREQKTHAADFNIQLTSPPEKAVLPFEGGEEKAWHRLNHYLWESDQLKNYKNTRNGLLGADYSSKFSPWLALGCISAKSIYYQVQKYEQERTKNQSTYWLIFELIWRDYFHFILKKYGSKLFQATGIKEEETEWKYDRRSFEHWANAETGVPFIDANMRELNETGFMSNRGRQIVASFLTKDLGLDWRMGAAYFEYALIDYDVASNWGNWAYVAGVGNDPRENRYFNILSQAKKYDPKGDYVRYWLSELKNISGFNIHKISLLNKKDIQDQLKPGKADYFNPIVDMEKWEY